MVFSTPYASVTGFGGTGFESLTIFVNGVQIIWCGEGLSSNPPPQVLPVTLGIPIEVIVDGSAVAQDEYGSFAAFSANLPISFMEPDQTTLVQISGRARTQGVCVGDVGTDFICGVRSRQGGASCILEERGQLF
jgi:hypothetical protein